MSSRGRIASLLICGLAIGLIIWLPAKVFLWALPARSTCESLSGSIWRGNCNGFSVDGSRSGDIHWALTAPDLRPLALTARIIWSRGDSHLDTTAHWRTDGKTTLKISRATISLQTLRDSLPGTVSLGPLASLTGRLEANAMELALQRNGIAGVQGVARLHNARSLRTDSDLGNFEAEFSGTNGSIRDLGGPIALRGTIRLPQASRYVIDARVSARQASLAQALGLSAPLDVSLEGQL